MAMLLSQIVTIIRICKCATSEAPITDIIRIRGKDEIAQLFKI